MEEAWEAEHEAAEAKAKAKGSPLTRMKKSAKAAAAAENLRQIADTAERARQDTDVDVAQTDDPKAHLKMMAK